MASIVLEGVTKKFGDHVVIDNVSLSVKDKEFVVLLGPSGCGKSTMLRMIAGLTPVSKGQISIGGEQAGAKSPHARDLAFVFQSYALYPNMTVRRNVAFPLMMRRFRWWYHLPVIGWWPKRRLERSPAISTAVENVARLLQISELLDRRPRTLSGGQRQRVALGRAMVRDPQAFLMDEPLSNLDAKLRVQMRSELVALHKEMQRTFIYVTHDQTEAMTMGTRIAVINEGVVQQFGRPREVFENPANVFVAMFVGNPPMSVVDAIVDSPDLVVAGQRLADPSGLRALLRRTQAPRGPILLGMRPEHVAVLPGPAPGSLRGTVAAVEHLGSETLVCVSLLDGEAHGHSSSAVDMFARVEGYAEMTIGDQVHIRPDLSHASLFDIESQKRLVDDGSAGTRTDADSNVAS